MTGPAAPVPVDVTDLVVRALRPLLAGRADPVAAGAQVSTETGRGPDGGPPAVAAGRRRRPHLGLARRPARGDPADLLAPRHHSAKALAALALALLSTPVLPGVLLRGDPVAAPVAGIDPYTTAPLATAAVAVYARTPTT